MTKHIAALFFIFICTTVGWMILGGAVTLRTDEQDLSLSRKVGGLWGTKQIEKAPLVYPVIYKTVTIKRPNEPDKTDPYNQYNNYPFEEQSRVENQIIKQTNIIKFESSDINVKIKLKHRKKGLLWYSTYRVFFDAKYTITNSSTKTEDFYVEYQFPVSNAIYDNFKFLIGGKEIDIRTTSDGRIMPIVSLQPGESKEIEISYQSQGLDSWGYNFGQDVSEVKNFKLVLNTDFAKVDFPEYSISPTKKQENDNGWTFTWQYSRLLSGVNIGIDMPKKLNPGPWVSRVTFFAPVSLFVFFFMVFILSILKNIRIHPMNYFFIAAGYFSFHLLMAYLVDHVSLYTAFIICSAVSLFLIISYMRLVIGLKHALVEIGLSQFIYQVGFSYTFFYEGYTGLTITILCIITLFIVMQMTGKIDWFNKNSKENQPYKTNP